MKKIFSLLIVFFAALFFVPQAEASILVTQATVSSGDSWTVPYTNGHTFEFDLHFSGQWPVLVCKNGGSGNVSVWFQGNTVYAKTSSGFEQFLGSINSGANTRYKVICNNSDVSLYANSNFVGSASDPSIDTPSHNFENHPSVSFLANGETHMTNFSIADSEQNALPEITSLTVPTETITQNTQFSISGEFTDANTTDTHTAIINWGDGNTSSATVTESNGSGSVAASHSYPQGGNYTISLTVADQNDASTRREAQVHVNVPPTITLITNTLSNGGTTYSGAGTFSDTDSSSWTGTVDYGDGSGVQALQIDGQNHTFSLNHTYPSNVVSGGYTVIVSMTDNQGLSTSTPLVKASVQVWQNKVEHHDTWTVLYSNGQTYEFDLFYDLQWPVLTCKSYGSDNVYVFFQTNEVYVKTSTGFEQFVGNNNKDINTHYKVVCNNDTVSVYINGNLLGTVTDPVLNIAPATFTNHPVVSFLANGNITSMTNFTISNANTPPIALDDSYSVNEDSLLTVAAAGVLANDSDLDGDNLSAVNVSGPNHGTLTLNADGSFTYTPTANYNGPDSFIYQAKDTSDALSEEATVTIQVNPVNDVPVAVSDVATTAKNTPTTILVLNNDSDVDQDPLTIISVSPQSSQRGTVTTNGTTVTYTPKNGFKGTDTFTYTISDGHSGMATTTVTVDVTK